MTEFKTRKRDKQVFPVNTTKKEGRYQKIPESKIWNKEPGKFVWKDNSGLIVFVQKTGHMYQNEWDPTWSVFVSDGNVMEEYSATHREEDAISDAYELMGKSSGEIRKEHLTPL